MMLFGIVAFIVFLSDGGRRERMTNTKEILRGKTLRKPLAQLQRKKGKRCIKIQDAHALVRAFHFVEIRRNEMVLRAFVLESAVFLCWSSVHTFQFVK